MQVVYGKEVDDDYSDAPVHCDVCGRETDEPGERYSAGAGVWYTLCPDCFDNAAECEECGKITTDYDEVRDPVANVTYNLCRHCAARRAIC